MLANANNLSREELDFLEILYLKLLGVNIFVSILIESLLATVVLRIELPYLLAL